MKSVAEQNLRIKQARQERPSSERAMNRNVAIAELHAAIIATRNKHPTFNSEFVDELRWLALPSKVDRYAYVLLQEYLDKQSLMPGQSHTFETTFLSERRGEQIAMSKWIKKQVENLGKVVVGGTYEVTLSEYHKTSKAGKTRLVGTKYEGLPQ